MCRNLRNKEYYISNKQYTKEEYKKKVSEYKLSSRKTIKKLQQEFEQHVRKDAIHQSVDNINCENVT
ncbi:hypothetical protein KKH82_06500 [Patescibacteria group bacterium]|nr:hypothetical protein [Patescibacteria group bacterium]